MSDHRQSPSLGRFYRAVTVTEFTGLGTMQCAAFQLFYGTPKRGCARERKSGSQQTPRWREPDSNHRSRSLRKGVSRLLPAGPISWTRVIKHRSSREATMVGRGPLLQGRLFDGGTDGSNPSASSRESCKLHFISRGLARRRAERIERQTTANFRASGRPRTASSTAMMRRIRYPNRRVCPDLRWP